MKYLFGPVNSRRLGLSLGVDLLPAKICTLNCVYCECGGTTDLTTEIREYVPTREVIAELDSFLADSPPLDAITFSGSGEPTLHSGLGDIVRYLKNTYPRYRVVLLTNGTLFWREDVRRAAAGCDIVIPSLDAVTPAAFNAVARPAPEITPDRVVEGLSAFRKEFAGRLIIEIFIVPGVNDGEEDARKVARFARGLKVKVNLIPYNGGPEAPFQRCGTEAVRRFQEILLADGIATSIRKSRGEDILAACGQLARKGWASEAPP